MGWGAVQVGVSAMCVLGFNVNAGQEIALRLRTDDLRGFRNYGVIIRTMLHELAHMVHSDHDDAFKVRGPRVSSHQQPSKRRRHAGSWPLTARVFHRRRRSTRS